MNDEPYAQLNLTKEELTQLEVFLGNQSNLSPEIWAILYRLRNKDYIVLDPL